MRGLWVAVVTAAALCPWAANAGGGRDEIAELRRMVEAMRRDYEARIEDLERRLAAAERRAKQAARAAPKAEAVPMAEGGLDRGEGSRPPVATEMPAEPPGPSVLGAVTSGTAFNPTISVILDGNYYNDDVDGRGNALLGEAFRPSQPAGHGHDHGHGGAEPGFNLREAEIFLGATVDPYFDAATYISVSGDGDVELEEGYFQTRSLPWGLRLKGGKFLSGIGYANEQYPHQWDFTTQNLPYLNLLGEHGLQDVGVQLTWLADWDYYSRFGFEVLTGDQERFGAFLDEEAREAILGETGLKGLNLSQRENGPRLYTAFAELSPDLGFRHELLLGGFGAYATQHQEVQGADHEHDREAEHDHDDHEDPEAAAVSSLDGDGWLAGAELVYFYDGGGPYGQGDLKLQSEYLWERKDLDVKFSPAGETGERTFTTDGLYVQGRYGFLPRWQIAARYDNLGVFANRAAQGGTTLAEFGSSERWSAALTWTPTEFSRFRFEWENASILRADGRTEDFNTFWVQFLMSLGSHGAHKF
jgi:hypothetical protein